MKEDNFVWTNKERAPKKQPRLVVTAISRASEKRSADASIANTDISSLAEEDEKAMDVILLPEGLLIPRVAATQEAVNALINTWLGQGLEYNSTDLVAALGARKLPYSWVVMICAHKKRDKRCGVIGPMLSTAFESTLKERGMFAEPDAISLSTGANNDTSTSETKKGVALWLCSHTGGHKVRILKCACFPRNISFRNANHFLDLVSR